MQGAGSRKKEKEEKKYIWKKNEDEQLRAVFFMALEGHVRYDRWGFTC